MTLERASVPCGDCHACCRSLVMLLPDEGDDVASYDHEIVTIAPGVSGPALKRKANGDCVYLDDAGRCSIWERAPLICRVFDCRRWYKNHSRAERRKLIARGADQTIFAAGRARLASLESA